MADEDKKELAVNDPRRLHSYPLIKVIKRTVILFYPIILKTKPVTNTFHLELFKS